METSAACHCGITIPMDELKSCLLDLQHKEENENENKIQRGSVMRRRVRKHSKADDLQHLSLTFETAVD